MIASRTKFAHSLALSLLIFIFSSFGCVAEFDLQQKAFQTVAPALARS